MICEHPKENTKIFINKRYSGKYEFIEKCLNCKKILNIMRELEDEK